MLQLEFLPHFSPQFSVLHCRYFYFHYFAGLSVGLKAACEAEAARAASEVIMNAIKLYRIGSFAINYIFAIMRWSISPMNFETS